MKAFFTRHPLRHVDGVSSIELFYDLIFVYCISVMTSLCHHVEGGFLDLGTWLIFLFSYLAILQIWFFTTLLMNRFGERPASDNICLFCLVGRHAAGWYRVGLVEHLQGEVCAFPTWPSAVRCLPSLPLERW